jgi:Predicted Peptidoglycan domain
MARFDISGSASRQTGLDRQMTMDAIRRQIEPQQPTQAQERFVAAPQQEIMQTTGYEAQEPMKTQSSIDDLPLPMQTVNWEARKDKQGNPIVYQLPAGDMGGKFEIAGINDRYHPEAFKAISSLPAEERAEAAAEYIRSYTAPLVSQLPKPMQAFAQDLAFNRGLGGAARYIQQGLRNLGQDISVDGKLGPKTLSAINNVQPRALMQAASEAQRNDEYAKARANPARKALLPGLENRIRNRFSILGNV